MVEGIILNTCGRLHFVLLAFRSRQMTTLHCLRLFSWKAVHFTLQPKMQDIFFSLYPLLNSPLCLCIDLVHIVSYIFILFYSIKIRRLHLAIDDTPQTLLFRTNIRLYLNRVTFSSLTGRC